MKQIIIPFEHFLFCLLSLFPLTQAAGQGFELVFEKGIVTSFVGERGFDIIETNDNNLLVLTNELGNVGQILKKLDPNGNLLWEQPLSANTSLLAVVLVEMPSGDILVAGDVEVPSQPDQRAFYWQVLSVNGAFIEEHTYHDGVSRFDCTGAVLSPNGQVVVAGFKNAFTPATETALLEIQSSGSVNWVHFWPCTHKSVVNNVAFLANGLGVVGYFAPGTDFTAFQTFDTNGNPLAQQTLAQQAEGLYDIEPAAGGGFFAGLYRQGDCIFKLDNNLQLEWSTAPQGTYGQLLSAVLAATPDGGCGATGYTIGQFLQLFKITPSGAQEWAMIWENGPFNPGGEGSAIVRTGNDGFAFTGQLFSDKNFVIATSTGGGVLPGTIEGRVFSDENANCQFDPSEAAFSGWQVAAVRQSTTDTVFATTSSNGSYFLPVNFGTYEVFLLPPNNLWMPCTPSYQLLVDAASAVNTAYFAMQPQVFCPLLQVDVGTNLLRPCMQSTYRVKYCNEGTDAALGAYVEVALDPLLFLTDNQLPATDLGNNTYRFEIGNVPPGFCGEFWFKANLACWATPGATHCVEAHIFPDSTCAPINPIWDASNIELLAVCENGEAKFTITNTGLGNMAAPLPYLVIEDNVLLRPGEVMLFQLESGADTTVVFPAVGRTLRLETQQSLGHPSGTLTAAWVEGCGATGSEPIEISYVTQYPLGDEEDFLTVDCRQNVFSYDPNDKLAFPQGIGNQRFIQNTTELDYQIRFQNTGTAPAFEVVLRDTLSPFLDPETLRSGASSHPYNVVVENGNVAVFTFPNINLPPQSAGEEASQGWVKFRIAQTPGNQPGSVIENEASIYFDQNPPIVTPLIFHQIPFPETTVNAQVTLCEGEAWQGQVFESDTTLSEVVHYAFFDSFFVTQLDVLPAANAAIVQTLCFGGSLVVNGTVYDASNPMGSETFLNGSYLGCDSTVQVMLSFYPPAVANLAGPICQNESIHVFESVFDINNPAGVVVIPGIGAGGCDSTVFVNLTILENSFSEIDTTFLEGGFWGETPINSDTSLMMVLPAANGCDSLVTVNISVLPNGVRQLASSNFNLEIHPNPASSVVWASFELASETELSWVVTTSLGKLANTASGKTKWQAGSHQLPIQLAGLPSGIYHLWVGSPAGRTVVKFVKID